MNRVRRTTLVRHAAAEMTSAGLPRLDASLSDLVAYGELTYSGALAAKGPAVAEVADLIRELCTLGWVPRKDEVTPLHDAVAS
jgi:chromosome partitioning protein